MTSLKQGVASATLTLRDAGVPSPEADALALAAHVLGVDASEVRRRVVMGDELDAVVSQRYAALLSERAARVPLQHLTGRAHFRHLTLEVGPGVFVPRPETELAAGLAITAGATAGESPIVVDLCTGSGAIALSVAKEAPTSTVYAVELSPEAHAWAQRNVEATGLAVELSLGDATTAYPELEGRVDVVVSNPPYIPVGMVPLDPEVRDHDPQVALYGGSDDGLAIPLAVAARAAALLRPGGVLVMEHADTQGATLPESLRRNGNWTDVVDHVDLNGRPRATVATRA
ncbi:peptide chain release factor N(5)-glutamine methyltransferase [Knoellia koreensis]|uniref:Release factor glutamine methyltransferase n=1 Tax=Knoellia koreensis TaxID=2730921 RepID=A0A849HGM9_9MICO|nr:peptide chain release factor N(5)-glutamine methyltransferase [Knoellia sp. DB2414S]